MAFLSDLSKGKLFGHPIHSMLVHFPLALLPVSLIFDLISFLKTDTTFALIGFYTMAAGTIGGYIAACFGFLDMIHLPDDKVISRKALIHASINGVVVASYSVLVLLRLKKIPAVEIPSTIELLSSGLLIILLFISAHFGGDLVYRHRIGSIKN